MKTILSLSLMNSPKSRIPYYQKPIYAGPWYLYWNEKENKIAVSENIFHQYVPIVRVLPLHFAVWREFTREFRFSKKSAVAKIVHSTLCSFLFRFYNYVRSVIIHKSRSEQFLWNRNWDLGWIWASLATFEAGFFMFSWGKKN